MRTFLSRLFVVTLAMAISACASVNPPRQTELYDILVIGGLVYDGSGQELPGADIAIKDGRIVFVAKGLQTTARAHRTIDANGLVVAPGFIDPHTHADADIAASVRSRRANLAYAYQGVTTVMVGNDGFGSPDIGAMASMARQQGIGTNVAYLAGFGAIRESAMEKGNRPPTAAELAQMKQVTRSAMCEGAWGLSAGLYYVPQNYAATDEVLALATLAGEAGGYYDTHLRDESTYNIGLLGAVEETLEIGRRARLPVHIAHIKALGPAVWGQSGPVIKRIERAQANGQRVTADQYPWEASGTRISNALVPRWALEGGLEALRARLTDPNQRARIAKGMTDGLARRGGADKLLVTGALGETKVPLGKTLAELADAMQLSAVETAIAILGQGDARVASFNMNEEDITAFAYRDWVITGSDGSSGHPRKYASFPKAYRDLVVNGRMSLARFIHRSSGQSAQIIGLKGRGFLKPSYAADIVIFDPAEFAPRASYQEPQELSAGVRYLIVNGVALISEGEYTGALPGQPLLKDTSC